MRFLCKVPLVSAAALSFGAFLFVAVQRLGYRYELEWLESGLVEHVRRLNEGAALYTPPTVDFVQFPYPPVYMFVSSAVALVIGDGFLALRLVSFISTLATLVLLFKLVSFETERRWAGLVAAGLYAATYSYVGTWFEVAKIDSLFIALTLAGILLLRRANNHRSMVVAGVVFALAVLIKQTALVIVAPMILYLVIARRRRALPFIASLTVVVGGVSLVMHFATEGWFTYFVWQQLLGHATITTDRFAFWTTDVAVFLPGLAVVVLAIPFWRRSEKRFAFGLYGAALVGCIAGAWASRLHEGGFANVLMPVCLIAAILIGCSVPSVLEGSRRWAAVAVTAFVLLQFWSFQYSPSSALPSDADERAGAALIELLSKIEGDVLVASHPTYAVYAGKPSHAQQGGTHDVLRSNDSGASESLRRSYADAIYSGRFAAIVLDFPGDASAFPPDWKNYYQEVPLTAIPEGDLVPRASGIYVPRQLWLRVAGEPKVG